MGTFSEMIAKTMFDEGAMATRGDSVPLAIDEVEWSDTDSSDEDGTPWEATQEDVEEDMKKWDAMMQERSAGKRGAVELMRVTSQKLWLRSPNRTCCEVVMSRAKRRGLASPVSYRRSDLGWQSARRATVSPNPALPGPSGSLTLMLAPIDLRRSMTYHTSWGQTFLNALS